MNVTRTSAVALALLAVAACGGSDDADSGAAPADTSADEVAEDAESGDDSEPSSGDGATADDATGDESAATGAPGAIAISVTIPTSGGLGESITLSPDGSRLAHFEGGLESPITIYDTATGEVLASGAGTGQGFDPQWTADDRLVTWDPAPTFDDDPSIWAVDATTLTALDPVVATGDAGATTCDPISEFAVLGDVVYSAGARDGRAMVCRLDLATNTLTAVDIEATGPFPQAFVTDDGTQLVVSDEGTTPGDPATAFVFDPTTLELVETIDLPGEVIQIGPGGIIVPAEQVEQEFVGGASLEARAIPGLDVTGPFIIGNLDADVVVMDGGGALVGSLGAGFPLETDASDDGATLAVRTAESILVVSL